MWLKFLRGFYGKLLSWGMTSPERKVATWTIEGPVNQHSKIWTWIRLWLFSRRHKRERVQYAFARSAGRCTQAYVCKKEFGYHCKHTLIRRKEYWHPYCHHCVSRIFVDSSRTQFHQCSTSIPCSWYWQISRYKCWWDCDLPSNFLPCYCTLFFSWILWFRNIYSKKVFFPYGRYKKNSPKRFCNVRKEECIAPYYNK